MVRMAVGHSDDSDVDRALATVFEPCEAGLDGTRHRQLGPPRRRALDGPAAATARAPWFPVGRR